MHRVGLEAECASLVSEILLSVLSIEQSSCTSYFDLVKQDEFLFPFWILKQRLISLKRFIDRFVGSFSSQVLELAKIV